MLKVIKKCPVCEMAVNDSEIKVEYRGIEHLFCTKQCKTRFESHPHLFVGDPKLGKAEKQKGRNVLKAHKIKLEYIPDNNLKAHIMDEIIELMGIQSASIENETIIVVYDLLQVSLKDIENAIIRSDGEMRKSLTENIKHNVIHFSEECELENLEHLSKGGGCH